MIIKKAEKYRSLRLFHRKAMAQLYLKTEYSICWINNLQ